MSGEARRPRMRGLRRGRGVRVRGGRGGRLVEESVVNVAVVPDRGGPSGRGRGRGGRANRPGPSSIDELVLYDIAELPDSRGLETAMHPKKMRRWQPPSTAPPPPPFPSPPHPAPLSPAPPSTAPLSPALPSPAPPSTASHSVPLPAMFLECESSSLPPLPINAPPPPRHFRQLRDEDISNVINNGSDEDSDESDDEEGIGFPFIPRVFRSLMDTPLDQDAQDNYDGEPEPAADEPEPTADEPEPTADEPEPAADMPADGPAFLNLNTSVSTTNQPWGPYEFDWRAFPNPFIPPESRRETFSESNTGPTTPSTDPYDIFIEIWDRQIMEHIASETNKYVQQVASQMLENNDLHPRSRISQWRDTTVDELYVYFGLILAMGIVVKSRIEEYWGSTPDIFYTPGFSAHMSIDRFVLLNKCVHFNDNNDMGALELDYSEARLHKIKPILLHLNQKFQDLYTPEQNIALDESLLMWKGWLEFAQLIPNKTANRGIKTYEICESQTGYLWRFEVHAHKKSPPQLHQDPLDASTPSIVLRLTKGLEHKGYTLWMDNFYQSPCLARRLKSLGFDCVGTLRTDRKFVPQAINTLTKRNMRPGQITGLTSGDVDVMVWRDTNRVAMKSTYHGNGQQVIRGSTKPILILDYNIMMGGVDKKDQLLAMDPVERKRTKVWYKKLFRRLLNISVLNSYIIHHHTSPMTTHRNFRKNFVKSLLSKHSQRTLSATAQNIAADVRHRLAEFPMRNHQRLRRACTVCKKQVRTFCVGCNKTVCMEPCFLTIHL